MFGYAEQERKPMTPERLFSQDTPLPVPDAGEYLGAHAAQGFDFTTTGRVWEEITIRQAEKAAGEYSEDYRQQQIVMRLTGISTPLAPPPAAMSEADWKASSWYRKGMAYRPDMTPTRARIMAENYDRRRYRDALISRGDEVFNPALRALGLGAVMLGSLPDPVNFIPFAGGVKAAGAGLRASIMAGLKTGAIEGAAGSLAADALVLPDLAARGEDVGFADAMLDTLFGAALGGLLGGIGGGAGHWWQTRTRQGDAVPEGRHAGTDLLRVGLPAKDRLTIAKAFEKGLADLSAGHPVNVAPIFR